MTQQLKHTDVPSHQAYTFISERGDLEVRISNNKVTIIRKPEGNVLMVEYDGVRSSLPLDLEYDDDVQRQHHQLPPIPKDHFRVSRVICEKEKV